MGEWTPLGGGERPPGAPGRSSTVLTAPCSAQHHGSSIKSQRWGCNTLLPSSELQLLSSPHTLPVTSKAIRAKLIFFLYLLLKAELSCVGQITDLGLLHIHFPLMTLPLLSPLAQTKLAVSSTNSTNINLKQFKRKQRNWHLAEFLKARIPATPRVFKVTSKGAHCYQPERDANVCMELLLLIIHPPFWHWKQLGTYNPGLSA